MGKHYKQLTYNDRLTIEKMLNYKKFTRLAIANTIGCEEVTIYREIKKGTVQCVNSQLQEIKVYSAYIAQKKTMENKKKQGAKPKAVNDKNLMAFIEKKILIDLFSPRVVVAYIKKHKMKFDCSISDFTIYRYVKKGYFENLTMKRLPYGKTYHKRYQKMQCRASFGTSIEKRPKYINDRQEFGHWEMDSVEGKKGESKKSLLVMTERKTRKELIFINENMTSQQVVKKLDYLEKKLGSETFNIIFKSITVDNGSEFADVNGIAKSKINKDKKRTDLYYCHPRTPTERGSNENANKLIRKYIPKGKNFDNEPIESIKFIQEEINNYPRKIFDFDTSNEKLRKELQDLEIPKIKYSILFH